jgi:tetratricopeptide (TPR) repeat protein
VPRCRVTLPSPQEYLPTRGNTGAKELESALIQAKNAIQLAPDLAEAHYLKGAIYLDLNDPPLAENALRQALAENGRSGSGSRPCQVTAETGKYQDLLDETVPERFAVTAHPADVESLRGGAYWDSMCSRGESVLRRALQQTSDFPDALIGIAKITAADRRRQKLFSSSSVLARSSNYDALLLRGLAACAR